MDEICVGVIVLLTMSLFSFDHKKESNVLLLLEGIKSCTVLSKIAPFFLDRAFKEELVENLG